MAESDYGQELSMPAQTQPLDPVTIQAEPKPLEVDRQRLAIVVVDMQNAFVNKGGMFDLMGHDLSLTQKIIEPINNIKNAARTKGIKVIYVAHRYSPDLRESGGPNSPFWHKGGVLGLYRQHPEWRDKLLIRGTWGTEITEELKPIKGEIVIEKPSFSAFFGTNMDVVLKTYDIKYLAFVGTATNICVEATIRDACYHGYFPILIADATSNTGPPLTQEATIFNIKSVYGWVTTTASIIEAILVS